MRKFFFTTLCLGVMIAPSFSQVGIGTPTPNTSSILELSSTTKAFIPPRMTTSQRNLIAGPTAGMMIFNTTTDCVEIYRSAGWYSLCSGGGTTPTDSTSNDVAASNLIAHWTFDTDGKEVISATPASTTSGVVFNTAGKLGNCATFTNGYLLYNPIPNISKDTALQSYSISMWVNIPTGANDVLRGLFLVTGNRFPDLWGNVAFELVNNGSATDVLPLNGRQVQVDGLAPYVHNETAGSDVAAGKNKWVFVTLTYDGIGVNQTMKIYADGALIQNKELTTVDKSPTSTQSTFRVVPTGNAAVPSPTPSNKVYIGTMAFKDRGNDGGDGYGNFAPNAADRPWAGGSITGKIDDIRLFNRSLTAAEVQSLYTRGNAGK